MAAIGSRRRSSAFNIWPGFVDALATLIMVVVFVLMIFNVFQFYLKDIIYGRDQALSWLNEQLGELADILAVERRATADLRGQLSQLAAELGLTIGERDRLRADLGRSESERRRLDQDLAALGIERTRLDQELRASEAERLRLSDVLTAAGAERERLAAALQLTTGERDRLQADLGTLTGERDRLQANLGTLTGERDRLQASLGALTGERDRIQAALTQTAGERDRSQAALAQTAEERDRLQTNLALTAAERERIQAALAQTAAERDRTQAALTQTAAERDRTQAALTRTAAERERTQAAFVAAETERDRTQAALAQSEADRARTAAERDRAAQLAAAQARQRELVSRELEDAYKTINADREKIEVQLRELAALQREIQTLLIIRREVEAKLAEQAKQLEGDRGALTEERKLSESARLRVDLLTRQVDALKSQLERLNAALEASETKTKAQQVQIADLGGRLNMALASRVEELARYRSEFFGRLREVLGQRTDIRVVGDRFVFQSEILFPVGSSELDPAGLEQLGQFADTLIEIAGRIPRDLPWVLQVEGHTDRRPIRQSFLSNWELSAARAIAVVKFLASRGIPEARLAAAGFGEFQPLDTGSGEEAFRRNRRIELKLTSR